MVSFGQREVQSSETYKARVNISAKSLRAPRLLRGSSVYAHAHAHGHARYVLKSQTCSSPSHSSITSE